MLCHQLIGRGECSHYKEREEECFALNVPAKNKKTLAEALSSFVEGELLEGGNAYKCAKCNKKVDTLKRVCLKVRGNECWLLLPPSCPSLRICFAVDRCSHMQASVLICRSIHVYPFNRRFCPLLSPSSLRGSRWTTRP